MANARTTWRVDGERTPCRWREEDRAWRFGGAPWPSPAPHLFAEPDRHSWVHQRATGDRVRTTSTVCSPATRDRGILLDGERRSTESLVSAKEPPPTSAHQTLASDEHGIKGLESGGATTDHHHSPLAVFVDGPSNKGRTPSLLLG